MTEDIALEVFETELAQYGDVLIKTLLSDRTTEQNIVWATEDYLPLGESYKPEKEITSHSVTGGKEKFIRPRITKSYESQKSRSREKAEVFTPSWVCNAQNNLVDNAWFGREGVFNTEGVKSWTPNLDKIGFSEEKGHRWEDYVHARRMEITCGEAPYLVSRYDTVTGDKIDINSRIGLLDRKLRVVNENVHEEEEWLKWVRCAFQSIYGFEFQGDNLILARENLLYTFIDNLKYKWERDATQREVRTIANIISWNLWQMDGLTCAVPYADERGKYEQSTLFDVMGDLSGGSEDSEPSIKNRYCIIKDWRSSKIVEYRELGK